MTERERLELRRQWAYDIRSVVDRTEMPRTFLRAEELVRNAEAEVIALDDPEAAERHRRIIPQF